MMLTRDYKSGKVSRGVSLILALLLFQGCNNSQQEHRSPASNNLYESGTKLDELPDKLYKRGTINGLAYIDDGRYHQAISYYNKWINRYLSLYYSHLDKFPTDLEALFALTLTYTQMGKTKKALKYAKRALKKGLPFERFLAGPRDLLRPLWKTTEFHSWVDEYNIELLHGPMLSNVTSHSAEFWVRTFHEVPVKVKISKSKLMSPFRSGNIITQKHEDYTGIISINKLSPDTRYYYQLCVNGKLQSKKRSFYTYSNKGQSSRFQVGFGGGAGYTPWHERMWDTLATHQPRAFLLMGDNVYIDHPLNPDIQRYAYYRRQSRPEFQNFTAGSSIYSIWDDHDFASNDSWGGPRVQTPSWKIPVWNIFKENWNNPSYGGGKNNPGVWYTIHIGDVEIFMLDVRYYRTNPNAYNPSMLGVYQKKWLFDQLKASKATFKIIASGVPWDFESKLGQSGADTWRGYKKERNEIFSFLEKNEIDGVILLSADRHRSEMWKIKYKGLYNLYSLESSKLTNIATHSCVNGSIYCYDKKASFGLLTLDTEKQDPELIYDIYNIDNEKVHSFKIKKSQLTFTE